MGTEHYLFDTHGRRAFVLGTGRWAPAPAGAYIGEGEWAGFPVDAAAHATPQDTNDALLRCWARTTWRERPTVWDRAYMGRLAPCVWAFFKTSGRVELRDDTWVRPDEQYTEDGKPTNFVVVGSRYDGDTNVRTDPLAAEMARWIAEAERMLKAGA